MSTVSATSSNADRLPLEEIEMNGEARNITLQDGDRSNSSSGPGSDPTSHSTEDTFIRAKAEAEPLGRSLGELQGVLEETGVKGEAGSDSSTADTTSPASHSTTKAATPASSEPDSISSLPDKQAQDGGKEEQLSIDPNDQKNTTAYTESAARSKLVPIVRYWFPASELDSSEGDDDSLEDYVDAEIPEVAELKRKVGNLEYFMGSFLNVMVRKYPEDQELEVLNDHYKRLI